MIFAMIFPTMLLCNLLWWRWADQRLRPLPHARRWRIALVAFMFVQIGCVLSIILLSRWARLTLQAMPAPLLATVYLWNLLIVPLSMLVILLLWVVAKARWLGAAVVRPAYRWADPPATPMPATADDPPAALPAPAPAPQPEGPTRRQVLAAAAVAIPPLLTMGATGVSFWQLDGFRIRRLDVVVPQLPQALDGLTIAHISDLHVGGFTTRAALKQLVETTNAMRADLVLLSGDLINHSLSDLPAGLDIVKRLDARYGLAMCEGNHDLFEDAGEFDAQVKASGVPLLVDETMTVAVRGEPVQLMGLRWGQARKAEDGTGRRRANPTPQTMKDSLSRLMTERRPDAFPILLAHHPHAFDQAAEAGLPLTLSGHTHGGQLMLSDHLGAGSFMFKYLSGLYRQGGSQLVVSNGVGNWFPLRVNAPAELIHLTLHRA